MTTKKYQVPNEEWSGLNLEDIAILPIASYSVHEWTPGRDGHGKPEQVHIHFTLDLPKMGNIPMAIRFKSRSEINRFITMLERHRDGVWPL